MSKSEQLTGTAWHTEKMHRSEDDERRYKGRCEYYRYKGDYCEYWQRKCTGSAHCGPYKAISDEEFKKRQRANAGKSNDDGGYWL